jgi:hypothetical protein
MFASLKTYKSWVCALVFSSDQFNESFSQSQRSTMKLTIATAILPLFLAHQAVGICPGYNFGIGNRRSLVGSGAGKSRCKCYTLPLTVNNDGLFVFSSSFLTGYVYDAHCNKVDSLTTRGNPCTDGMFGCSPAPVIFNRYTSNENGLVLVT